METKALVLKSKIPPSTPRTYQQLLKRVKEILEAGRARAKRALEFEEIVTWWQGARVINDHLRIHEGRAKYGEKTVPKLARGLEVADTYLYDILRFQERVPILHLSAELTLTHYRILARIENGVERERLHQKAIRGKLSVPGLLREIRLRKVLSEPDLKLEGSGQSRKALPLRIAKRKSRPLAAKRGEFYTYHIIRPSSLHGRPKFFSLDLGLRSRYDTKLAGIKRPQVGDIVRSIRTKKLKAGDQHRFVRSTAGKSALGSYVAAVTELHDADTYWLDFDLGFRHWLTDKIRLYGIDAKELNDGGRRALRYVKKVLSKVSFVVVTFRGFEKFGRPLIDLFYLEGADNPEQVLREGKYLNQELLSLGLAVRV
jgi:endonuclease YncB( thermonuclease family)